MNNNLEEIKNKLTHLAKHHAQEFILQKTNPLAEGEFNLKELVDMVISLDFFEAFDKAAIERTIDQFQSLINNLLNSSVLTKSKIGEELMPVCFDALLEIFGSSDENFRQKYFQQLVSLYYEELCKNIKRLGCKTNLERVVYDFEVKVLLPLAKLRIISQWSQENSVSQKDKVELLSNIGLYFKFPVINQEDVYEVLKNKIGSNNYQLKSYELIPLDEKNGHLGEYFKLKIIVDVEKTVQIFDLFAKILTPKTAVMKKILLSGPSKKEDFFYTTYIPLLKKYGLESLLDFAPGCYLSRLNDIVVMDDMAARGFKGLTPNMILKYDAVQQVIKKLAKFHASTMILEEMLSQEKQKRIALCDIFPEFLQESLFVPGDDYFLKHNFDIGRDTMVYLALKFPELTAKFSKEFLKEKIEKGWKLHFDKLKKSASFKNTMCHGDMHVANMLFKFNKETICQDVYLIDFQLLRFCPPTHDLIFFLHQSCAKEVRDKHLKQLCDQYYDELTRHIEKFGFNIEKVYPREDFEKSLRYMKSQAVFHALYYSQITMLSPKLREEIFSNQEKADYYLYKNRWELVNIGLAEETYSTILRGLIEDFVELCDNYDL